jgi:hypothetical protein
MVLKGEKSSMVVLEVEGSCQHERRLSAIRREGDDAIVIFRSSRE